MAELNIQAIKDRVARGRLQGGNPTGGEDGPFHLYHLALDDLDALIVVADPEEIAKRDARIEELEAQLADAKATNQRPAAMPGWPLTVPPGFPAGISGSSVISDGGTPVDAFQSSQSAGLSDAESRGDFENAPSAVGVLPHVADITDEERAELLKVAEEHKE